MTRERWQNDDKVKAARALLDHAVNGAIDAHGDGIAALRADALCSAVAEAVSVPPEAASEPVEKVLRDTETYKAMLAQDRYPANFGEQAKGVEGVVLPLGSTEAVTRLLRDLVAWGFGMGQAQPESSELLSWHERADATTAKLREHFAASQAENLLLGLHKIVADLAPYFDKPLTEESIPRWLALDSAQKAVAGYFATDKGDQGRFPNLRAAFPIPDEKERSEAMIALEGDAHVSAGGSARLIDEDRHGAPAHYNHDEVCAWIRGYNQAAAELRAASQGEAEREPVALRREIVEEKRDPKQPLRIGFDAADREARYIALLEQRVEAVQINPGALSDRPDDMREWARGMLVREAYEAGQRRFYGPLWDALYARSAGEATPEAWKELGEFASKLIRNRAAKWGVTQTITGDDGNCLEAALATVLGVTLEDVPRFRDETWWGQLLDFLATRGLSCQSTMDPPSGLSIAVGESPRRSVKHAVVAINGVLAFDPHPDRTFFKPASDVSFLSIAPLSPARSAGEGTGTTEIVRAWIDGLTLEQVTRIGAVIETREALYVALLEGAQHTQTEGR